MLPEEVIAQLARARCVAVLTGAGISQESGVPTFRGAGGLWNNYRAEDLATPAAFARDPVLVWQWYQMRRGLCAQANPNAGHEVVAAMEKHFDCFLLITQNVDGLHGRAGSREMIEIHGNLWSGRCVDCGLIESLPAGELAALPPRCSRCQGALRPNVLWFGESYDTALLERALQFLAEVDFLLVVGTSGLVSIPLSLARVAAQGGALIVDVNPADSGLSTIAHHSLRGRAGEVLPLLWTAANKTLS